MRSKTGSLASLVYRTTQQKKETKLKKNENGKLVQKKSGPVQSEKAVWWVLADYGGTDLWKGWILSLEWNNNS